jgi:hypothetical protein
LYPKKIGGWSLLPVAAGKKKEVGVSNECNSSRHIRKIIM